MWTAASLPQGKCTTMKTIPEFDVDIFSRESVRNANAVDDRLREFARVPRAQGLEILLVHLTPLA
jgi:hypothetical protein